MQKTILLAALMLACGTAQASDKDDGALTVASQCGWVRNVVFGAGCGGSPSLCGSDYN
jgi:hypothetical protein